MSAALGCGRKHLEPTQANDSPSVTSASFEQRENRSAISSTFDVLNEDRLSARSEEQPKKKELRFFAAAVSNEDRSSEASELHPENIWLKSVTDDVSIPAKFTASSFEQSANR